MQITTADPREILQRHFGYDDFRPGQRGVIDAIAAGRDCVGIMPTGAGKSICYQVPALALDGVTIVISPLVSLMNDQVSALIKAGIPAAYLNSQLTFDDQQDVLAAAGRGAHKLLYVAPERLDDPRFLAFVRTANIPLVAVDEAHCVSQWGQDFRPSYLGISAFIDSFAQAGRRPVVAAFTATATPRVADDIARLLALRDPVRVTTGFDRPNLHFAVEQLSDQQKVGRILTLIRENPAESGIVYCSTKKQVDALAAILLENGIRATSYHAGLSPAARTANQRAFVNDDAPVIVATNAFGMGIDKSNVRYVAHFNMPASLEAYYQEAGRAGRDGEPATCLLLWNAADISICRYFIESDSENEALTSEEAEVVRASQRRRLAAMTGYCMTCDCLRATILRYFGDPLADPASETVAAPAPEPAPESAGSAPAASAPTSSAPAEPSAPPPRSKSCGNCSNCVGAVESVDVTLTARSVMRCVHEVRGRFGKGLVTDILTGSKNAKIREYGLERARTYGCVSDSPATVKEIIELLTAGDYLVISEGRYPLVGLGPRAREAATDDFRLYMKKVSRTSRAAAGRFSAGGAGEGADRARAAGASATLQTPEQQETFERLRALRKRIASEEGVPPYIVFSDAALRGMCVLMPADEDEFLQVSGVGQAKLTRYGAQFLAEINRPRPPSGSLS